MADAAFNYDPALHVVTRLVRVLNAEAEACETEARRCDELVAAAKLTARGVDHMKGLREMYFHSASLLRGKISEIVAPGERIQKADGQ